MAEPAAAEVDQCSDDDDDEDDPVIRNLNLMSRLNLMTPEWIENRRRLHYEEIDLFNRSYDALEAMENGDYEPDDEAAIAEHEEWSKRLSASVDLSGLNTVGGESCGMDAVAVYPMGVNPPEENEYHDAALLRNYNKFLTLIEVNCYVLCILYHDYSYTCRTITRL